jgi:hypothetical protein
VGDKSGGWLIASRRLPDDRSAALSSAFQRTPLVHPWVATLADDWSESTNRTIRSKDTVPLKAGRKDDMIGEVVNKVKHVEST